MVAALLLGMASSGCAKVLCTGMGGGSVGGNIVGLAICGTALAVDGVYYGSTKLYELAAGKEECVEPEPPYVVPDDVILRGSRRDDEPETNEDPGEDCPGGI